MERTVDEAAPSEAPRVHDYVPRAQDLRDCERCGKLCAPFPRRESGICAWCFWQNAVRLGLLVLVLVVTGCAARRPQLLVRCFAASASLYCCAMDEHTHDVWCWSQPDQREAL